MCLIHFTPCPSDLSNTLTHTDTHNRFTALLSRICPGPPGWAGTRKVKPCRQVKTNLDLLEQEIVSGSGICWAICKVCTSSQTTPTSHHSVFYRPDALPRAQPTVSKHWRQPDLSNLVIIRSQLKPYILLRVKYTVPMQSSYIVRFFLCAQMSHILYITYVSVYIISFCKSVTSYDCSFLPRITMCWMCVGSLLQLWRAGSHPARLSQPERVVGRQPCLLQLRGDRSSRARLPRSAGGRPRVLQLRRYRSHLEGLSRGRRRRWSCCIVQWQHCLLQVSWLVVSDVKIILL